MLNRNKLLARTLDTIEYLYLLNTNTHWRTTRISVAQQLNYRSLFFSNANRRGRYTSKNYVLRRYQQVETRKSVQC